MAEKRDAQPERPVRAKNPRTGEDKAGLDAEPGIGQDPSETEINASQQNLVPEEEVRRPVRKPKS